MKGRNRRIPGKTASCSPPGSGAIKNKFPENGKINDILEQLRVIEEEEKQEKQRKKEKIRQKQKLLDKKYGRGINSIRESYGKNKKFVGTLSQTFKDSNKYKKIDGKDFFNTRNFIGDNNYYNSAQGFYHSNDQINNDININNNMYNNENNIDYNKLEDKEILIRELLNEYKLKLNKELYEFIDSEEKKEKERINLYHNTTINRKEEVKQHLDEERANSSQMINKFIEEKEKKLKEFENELKIKYNL